MPATLVIIKKEKKDDVGPIAAVGAVLIIGAAIFKVFVRLFEKHQEFYIDMMESFVPILDLETYAFWITAVTWSILVLVLPVALIIVALRYKNRHWIKGVISFYFTFIGVFLYRKEIYDFIKFDFIKFDFIKFTDIHPWPFIVFCVLAVVGIFIVSVLIRIICETLWKVIVLRHPIITAVYALSALLYKLSLFSPVVLSKWKNNFIDVFGIEKNNILLELEYYSVCSIVFFLIWMFLEVVRLLRRSKKIPIPPSSMIPTPPPPSKPCNEKLAVILSNYGVKKMVELFSDEMLSDNKVRERVMKICEIYSAEEAVKLLLNEMLSDNKVHENVMKIIEIEIVGGKLKLDVKDVIREVIKEAGKEKDNKFVPKDNPAILYFDKNDWEEAKLYWRNTEDAEQVASVKEFVGEMYTFVLREEAKKQI